MEKTVERYRVALLATIGLNLLLIIVAGYFFFQWRGLAVAQTTIAEQDAVLVSPVNSFTPTAMPSPTMTAIPTNTPAVEPEPAETPPATPTQTSIPATPTVPPPPPTLPSPTETAVPEMLSATPTLAPGPDWLRYTNLFRVQARLPQLSENSAYSAGSKHHSEYMIQTNTIKHGEQPTSPFFNQSGHDAAVNGNLAVSNWDGASDIWPINYWISAAFHALPILNPRLTEVGYGVFRDPASNFKVTGTMHVSTKLDLGDIPPGIDFPVMFPGDGGETWIHEYTLPEFPNPLESCPGYQRPTGPPIILQIGDGSLVPNVHDSTVRTDGTDLQHCVIHESNYLNTNDYFQTTGRTILDQQDAIVLIPRQPFIPGNTYEITVVVGDDTHRWSFQAVNGPGNY